MLRVPLGVFRDRRRLAETAPLGEFFGDGIEPVARRIARVVGGEIDIVGTARQCHRSSPPGSCNFSSTPLRRSRARTYRLLAAAGWIPSTAAASWLLSSSKCRRAR